MPAKAGIQNLLKLLGYRLRGNDVKGRFKTFCETIKIGKLKLSELMEIQSIIFILTQINHYH